MKVNARLYLVAALALLGATLLLRFLVKGGVLDGDVGTRAWMVATGVVIAVMGNSVPKTLKALRSSAAAERRAQAALRAVGWTTTGAGLVCAIVWVAAPERVAEPVSLGVLAMAFAFTVYRSLNCRFGGGLEAAARNV